jgi:hypothetical protein
LLIYLATVVEYVLHVTYDKPTVIPLQAWTGLEGSKRLRLPEFLNNQHMKGARLSALQNARVYPHNISITATSV